MNYHPSPEQCSRAYRDKENEKHKSSDASVWHCKQEVSGLRSMLSQQLRTRTKLTVLSNMRDHGHAARLRQYFRSTRPFFPSRSFLRRHEK